MASLFHSRHVKSWQPFYSMAKARLTQERPKWSQKNIYQYIYQSVKQIEATFLPWCVDDNKFLHSQWCIDNLTEFISQSQTITVNMYIKYLKLKSTWNFHSDMKKKDEEWDFLLSFCKPGYEISLRNQLTWEEERERGTIFSQNSRN